MGFKVGFIIGVFYFIFKLVAFYCFIDFGNKYSAGLLCSKLDSPCSFIFYAIPDYPLN